MAIEIVSSEPDESEPPEKNPGQDTALHELSDDDLLVAVRAGHADAYGILFTRHRHTAIRTASRILGNHHLAEDAAHEAFKKILAAIKSGAGPVHSFSGYLRTCVTRESYQSVRHWVMEKPVPDHPEEHHPIADFAEHLINPDLFKAFQSLPKRWQLILWYIDVQDLPTHQVAKLFDITPNATAALHRRAKKGLNRAYTQQISTTIHER